MNRNIIIQKFSTIVLVEKPATSLRISLIILSRRFKSINQKKNVEENGKMKNSEDNEKSRGGFARYEKPRCFFGGWEFGQMIPSNLLFWLDMVKSVTRDKVPHSRKRSRLNNST